MKFAKFIPIIVFLSKSVYSFYQKKRSPASSDKPASSSSKHSRFKNDIARLYRNRTSDAIVTAQGTVIRILSDDLVGDRHQRFVVRITSDISVLIAHNIDMAKRVPIKKGSFIRFKGEYEWNEQGGIIHWTHHDPKGWHEDGWIDIDNIRLS